MPYEILVGLHVTDDKVYQDYRENMTPLLLECGGGFGYDFKIAEVLKSQTKERINRVFTIHFPDEEVMERFFSNESYLAIREKYFESSVASTTIIAGYARESSET